jgi:hypothetical protein
MTVVLFFLALLISLLWLSAYTYVVHTWYRAPLAKSQFYGG